jgi:hypothetical protein
MSGAKLLCSAVILLFSFFSGAAQKSATQADSGAINFEVNGALTIQLKEATEFSYCIHHNGVRLDSQFVKKSKPFSITLKRNEVYTLSYHKDGYTDKYVVIDTHVPKNKAKKEYYELAFEIELMPEHSLHKEEYKDHPVAIFKYYKNKDDFDFSTKYFEEIHHKDKVGKKKELKEKE